MKNVKRTKKGEQYIKEKAGEYKPLEKIKTIHTQGGPTIKDILNRMKGDSPEEVKQALLDYQWKEMEEEFIKEFGSFYDFDGETNFKLHGEIIEWFKQRTIAK